MFPTNSVSSPKNFILHYGLGNKTFVCFRAYAQIPSWFYFGATEISLSVISKQTATRYKDYACKQSEKMLIAIGILL